MRAALLLVGLCACAARAAPATPAGITRLDGQRLSFAEVDRTVTAAMARAGVVGLALVVINQGEVVFSKGYGHRDGARRLPLGTTTVMHGASFTKAAFAHLVLQLADAGVIDLDRPIERVLGRSLGTLEGYRELAGDPRTARLTPRMLLSHTSGFPNYRQLVPGGRLAFFFPPGARYTYSGEGINLLALVVESVTGAKIEALMDERVFRRFGMTRTSLTWRADFESDFAVGHDQRGQPLRRSRYTRARAAGTMDTTIADYARFLAAVLRGEGLSPARQAEMLRPQIAIFSRRQFPTLALETTDDNRKIGLSYGLGWGLFQSRHGPAFFKEGHEDGWENHGVCFVDRKTCVVLMSNSENGEKVFLPLLDALLGAHDTPGAWHGYR